MAASIRVVTMMILDTIATIATLRTDIGHCFKTVMKEHLQQCMWSSCIVHIIWKGIDDHCLRCSEIVSRDWTEWDRRSPLDKACRSESDGWLCLPNTDVSTSVFKNAGNMKGRPHEKRSYWSTPISTEPCQNSEWWYQKDNFNKTISYMRWTGGKTNM